MDLAPLLYRGESESLDFKRYQYPFVNGDERQKSELLKDLLAMANSWRSETAFILIGVDASRPSPQVIGLTDHIDDASLQQFVHGKTQRPLKFSYYPAQLQGKAVGVIEIPVQPRPIHLRQDFGKLRANTVYMRRGSSTGEATPDEIAQMGLANSTLRGGDLVVRFAEPDSRKTAGSAFTFESTVIQVDGGGEIPDFEEPQAEEIYAGLTTKRPNPDFYRELVRLAKQMHLLKPAALTVENTGSVAAKEIRVEFTLSDPDRNWEFCEARDYKTRWPEEYYDRLMPVMRNIDFPVVSRRGDPGYDFEYIGDAWHLNFDFGYLQPSRILWPAMNFYIGARQSATLRLEGRIMADGLPAAAPCSLELRVKVARIDTTLEDLIKIYEKRPNADTDE
jgi:hypothetical protein